MLKKRLRISRHPGRLLSVTVSVLASYSVRLCLRLRERCQERGWEELGRQAGREPPTDPPAGGLDSPTYSEMLPAAVARAGRERAQARQTGSARADAQGGPEQPGSLASGWDWQPANRAVQRRPSPPRLPSAIGSGGLSRRTLQPPDAENRTSGDIGGRRGAIPVPRRDRFAREAGKLRNSKFRGYVACPRNSKLYD